MDNWSVKFCFEIFLLRCASRLEYLRAAKYAMKIIPTLIHNLPTQNDERAVISFEVYQLHPGRYYHNCFDPKNGVAPVVIEDWDRIKLVDYKLFHHHYKEPQWDSHLRQDLDRFLMNSQPHKCLHVSLDDHRMQLSWQFLAQNFTGLKWRGRLAIQIVDRTATSNTQRTIRTISKFFSGQQFDTIEYHRQLISGPPDSPAEMHDLGYTGFIPQHYLHDPPLIA